MCRIKEGANIKTEADLQNLVASVILRQTTAFSLEDVCNRVETKAVGSQLNNSKEIMKRCSETISALYLIDCIRNIENNRYKLTMTFPAK